MTVGGELSLVWGVEVRDTRVPVPAGGKTFGLRDIWQSPRAHSVKAPGELCSVRPVPPVGPPYKSKCYFSILRGNSALAMTATRTVTAVELIRVLTTAIMMPP
jgi:hypothetical protein